MDDRARVFLTSGAYRGRAHAAKSCTGSTAVQASTPLANGVVLYVVLLVVGRAYAPFKATSYAGIYGSEAAVPRDKLKEDMFLVYQ